VRQGQLLVELDARDLEAGYRQADAALNEARSAVPEAENAVSAARAQLELAQATFRRMKDLFDKKSVSNQEFDEAAARLRVAQAGHEMAQARRAQLTAKIAQAEAARRSAEVMRGYAQITAPFDGLVTAKNVEAGDLAAPGAPLLTVERQGDYRLEASIEESRLAQIRAGQSAEVVLDALDRTLSGRVAEIVPAVDAAARAFTVKIDLPALPQLRSGLFGRARFRLGSRQAITVPAGAVTERGQLFSVLVVEDNRARTRLVTVGQRLGERFEVLSGLNAGDRVIHPAPPGLTDGARVEVRP
jgi:RND family efflux transporter MFP subunit